MSMINKELYDALLEANVSDEKATAAARSLVSGKEDTADLKVRLASVEESRSATKQDIADIKEDISNMKLDIANMKADIAHLKARLSLAEKLQWAILAGVIGILIKGFIG